MNECSSLQSITDSPARPTPLGGGAQRRTCAQSEWHLKRRADGLRQKLLDYFERCPGEELRYDDIAIKFGRKVSVVRSTVNAMVRRGEVEALHVVRLPERRRAG